MKRQASLASIKEELPPAESDGEVTKGWGEKSTNSKLSHASVKYERDDHVKVDTSASTNLTNNLDKNTPIPTPANMAINSNSSNSVLSTPPPTTTTTLPPSAKRSSKRRSDSDSDVSLPDEELVSSDLDDLDDGDAIGFSGSGSKANRHASNVGGGRSRSGKQQRGIKQGPSSTSLKSSLHTSGSHSLSTDSTYRPSSSKKKGGSVGGGSKKAGKGSRRSRDSMFMSDGDDDDDDDDNNDGAGLDEDDDDAFFEDMLYQASTKSKSKTNSSMDNMVKEETSSASTMSANGLKSKLKMVRNNSCNVLSLSNQKAMAVSIAAEILQVGVTPLSTASSSNAMGNNSSSDNISNHPSTAVPHTQVSIASAIPKKLSLAGLGSKVLSSSLSAPSTADYTTTKHNDIMAPSPSPSPSPSPLPSPSIASTTSISTLSSSTFIKSREADASDSSTLVPQRKKLKTNTPAEIGGGNGSMGGGSSNNEQQCDVKKIMGTDGAVNITNSGSMTPVPLRLAVPKLPMPLSSNPLSNGGDTRTTGSTSSTMGLSKMPPVMSTSSSATPPFAPPSPSPPPPPPPPPLPPPSLPAPVGRTLSLKLGMTPRPKDVSNAARSGSSGGNADSSNVAILNKDNSNVPISTHEANPPNSKTQQVPTSFTNIPDAQAQREKEMREKKEKDREHKERELALQQQQKRKQEGANITSNPDPSSSSVKGGGGAVPIVTSDASGDGYRMLSAIFSSSLKAVRAASRSGGPTAKALRDAFITYEKPVNVTRIVDYNDYVPVAEMMSLSVIQKRVQQLVYGKAEQFMVDVRQLAVNARRYNLSGTAQFAHPVIVQLADLLVNEVSKQLEARASEVAAAEAVVENTVLWL
eukprot:CAMPEP_0175066624 /NCGR_PEP_ID=MMETSP0052_2-20121109/16620_1 /TAXON_ID=51329 ORGANISM="Polytomella parva, Strain SAG 63-3" /NCGR_SAMPLE_ID=MMETSP0052_2 /ASSEMBLY_ACC=CAM_ASM_000194 /LENGTH=861 /DNA_ID=CAMNT_0016333363 /DNA_START=235 /DNA_END=2817 /DNA_ORIENTATION=-